MVSITMRIIIFSALLYIMCFYKTWVSIIFQNFKRLNCCQNRIFVNEGLQRKHSETSLMKLFCENIGF